MQTQTYLAAGKHAYYLWQLCTIMTFCSALTQIAHKDNRINIKYVLKRDERITVCSQNTHKKTIQNRIDFRMEWQIETAEQTINIHYQAMCFVCCQAIMYTHIANGANCCMIHNQCAPRMIVRHTFQKNIRTPPQNSRSRLPLGPIVIVWTRNQCKFARQNTTTTWAYNTLHYYTTPTRNKMANFSQQIFIQRSRGTRVMFVAYC